MSEPQQREAPERRPEGRRSEGRSRTVRVREILDERGKDFLEVAARQLLDGEARSLPLGPRQRPLFQHGMLRWALSDDPGSRRDWAVLAQSAEEPVLRDRDRFVEELWQRVEAAPEHADLRGFLQRHLGAQSFYAEYLFDWFLRRFHPAAALRLYGAPVAARVLYAVLLVLAIVVVTVAAGFGFVGPAPIVAGLTGLVLLPFAVRVLTGRGWGQAAQLLFPRLAAGVAIGYLFLLSAPHLVRVAAREQLGSAVVLALGIVGATLAYTVFHVSRRVHPPLRLGHLVRRALPLVVLGGAYSLLGLALFSPIFTLAAFHGVDPAGSSAAAVPDLGVFHRLLLAAVALGLGMVLELAWEEKPLTEPL